MKPHFILSLLVISLALLAVGCLSKPASSAIDLADLRALEPVADEGVIPLRIAIAAVLSPQGTLESYQPLLDYMGEQLNRPIQLIQRRTYQEVNILIEQGEVDVAFVCTGAYVAGSRDFGMELLAVPQVNGETVYHSYLIVAASSAADDLMDLRGATFAFTDPMSMTGFFYPSSLVRTLGNEPETFFSRIFFTYSHDKAINAVASGVADAAAVDSLVYDAAISQHPDLAHQTHIIHRSTAFGIPPVVVNPNTRPQVKAELQRFLLDLANTAEGRAVLQPLGFERFVTAEDADYETVRNVMASLEDALAPREDPQ